MGWTGVYGNFKTPTDFFQDYFAKEIADGRILGYEINPENAFNLFIHETEGYMAYKTDAGKVIGVVVHLDVHFLDQQHPLKGQKEYLVKEISETEGPSLHKCPKRILDLLDPPMNEEALQWRRLCGDKREYPEFEEEQESRPSMSM